MIFWGMGISQHIHGTDNSRCLISLALLCGHVGRPGTGLHPLRGQNNVQGASDAGLIPMFLPDYQSVTDPEVRGLFGHIWQGTEIDEKPGLTVVEIVDAMYRGEIRGMYVMGENPAMSDPDVEHARRGAGQARAPGGAGRVPDRDRVLRRRDPARLGLAGEDRDRHQHQPPGADGPQGAGAAGRGARGLAHHRRHGEPARARLGLRPSARGLRGDEDVDAQPAPHHLGAAGARELGDLSLPRPRRPRPAGGLRRRLPAPRRARQVHARAGDAAGGGAGPRVPVRADHRAPARALAHRLDDPPGDGARRAGAGGELLAAPRHAAPARRRPPAGGCA